MKKITTKLATLKTLAPMLGYTEKELFGTMTLKDGSSMTSKLTSFKTPEGHMILNISDVVTFDFDSVAEYNEYISRKFKIHNTEKEMYLQDWGMDEETWEEWNK